MKNLFERLFLPNWQVRKVIQGKWEISHYYEDGKYRATTTEVCTFEILYSSTRNQWKLRVSGYQPKKHKNYAKSVERLNQLRLNPNYKPSYFKKERLCTLRQ